MSAVPPNPDTARQKFYTRPLDCGCSIVAFYNHSITNFNEEEVLELVRVATETYGHIPWQTTKLPEGRTALGLFVWVDMTDDYYSVGAALSGDQIRIGHCTWEKARGYELNVPNLINALRRYAEGWRSRPDNVTNLEELEQTATV